MKLKAFNCFFTSLHTATFLLITTGVFLTSCEQIDFDESFKNDRSVIQESLTDGINYNVNLKSAKYLVQSAEESKQITSIEPLIVDGDTLMYIFNFEDGWLIVSGDKRTEPILASDEVGNLSTEKLNNPGVANWISDRADHILFLKKTNPQIEFNSDLEMWLLIDKAAHFSLENLKKYQLKYGAITSTDSLLKSARITPVGYIWVKQLISVTSTPWTTSSTRGPILQTKWGQGSPWNTNVPFALKDGGWVRCPTGCTAVAMAQIIYNLHYNIGKPTGLYHEVLSTGYIYDSKNYSVSFNRSNYVANSNRWDMMPRQILGFYPDYITPNASYVANLMADVGNRVGMTYGATGSGANPSKGAFSAYGISSEEGDYNYSTVYNNLSKGTPVLVTAYAKRWTTGTWFWEQTHYGDGHAWVIDGYRSKQKTYTYTYEWVLVRDDAYATDALQNAYDPYYDSRELLPKPIIKPNEREVSTSTSSSTYLLMNWGWNGTYDTGEYSTGSSAIWKGSDYDFQYKKRIFYNFK